MKLSLLTYLFTRIKIQLEEESNIQREPRPHHFFYRMDNGIPIPVLEKSFT